jgi:hypothetical protein
VVDLPFVTTPDDSSLFENLCLVLWAFVLGWGGVLLYRLLRRSRPNLGVGMPLVLGAAIRVAVAASVSLTSYGAILRGPDEQTWLENASAVTREGPFSELGIDELTTSFHVWIIAVQNVIGPVPELSLRMVQIAFAMAGVLLIVVAVHDLAGVRAARLAAWLLALEPSGVFFSGVLLKEPILLFAGGLAAYGGTRIWRRGGLNGVGIMVAAGAVAVATRPYAGWFLVTACVLIAFHAALRHLPRRPSGTIVGVGFVILLSVSTPLLAQLSSEESLSKLQSSQDANASDESNLRLDRVDYSSREDVARNLPSRIADVLLRPYPWQVENLSQQLGALGSLGALMAFGLLIQAALRSRGRVLLNVGPLAYVGVALVIAYSLSAGNAGTSFRYRTHIVAFAIASLVILRDGSRGQRRVVLHNWGPATLPPLPLDSDRTTIRSVQ